MNLRHCFAIGTLVCLSAFGVTACAGPVNPIGPAMQTATNNDSWMRPDAKNGPLLYVSDKGTGAVTIFTYPGGEKVGGLSGFGYPIGECVDKRGDVWVTSPPHAKLYEYAHGGTSPIATLADSGQVPWSCSVDPTTGDLAVVNFCSSSNAQGCDGPGSIVTYKKSRGNPKGFYTDSNMYFGFYCAYDSTGNLFVDGENSSEDAFQFAELPARGNGLTAITVNQTIFFAGGVQWDGSNLVIGDQEYQGQNVSGIYRVSVSGSQATVVGSAALTGSMDLQQFFVDGKKLVGPNDSSAPSVLFWKYPGGGAPTRALAGDWEEPYAAVVSVAK
jgi:hypothetical protein